MKLRKKILKNIIRDLLVVTEQSPKLLSIFGSPNQKLRKYSELDLSNFKSMGETLTVFRELLIPTVPIPALRRKSKNIPEVGKKKYSVPGEKWFFINGIDGSPPIAKLNAKALSAEFHRPIKILHNPTDGFLTDIVECFVGRSLDRIPKITRKITKQVDAALVLPDNAKIVVIAHSQGGIIMSNVLKILVKKYSGNPILKKLEVYLFAAAADEMTADPKQSVDGALVPWIEHFANTKDFIASIGVLAYQDDIDGDVYTLKRSGHLLNQHYLPYFSKGKYCDKTSRLFKYRKGGIE